MKNLIYLSVFLFIGAFLNSCSDDVREDLPYSVDITIIEPLNGEVFTSGDELHMEIDFERSGTIHYVDVVALNTTTGDTIYYSGIIHADAEDYYPFHEHQDLDIAVVSNCKLIASSWEHDPLEKISEEVDFTVNP